MGSRSCIMDEETPVSLTVATIFNATTPAHEYSPLILASDWSRTIRLMVFTTCCVVGTIMNIFFISSFIIERTLRKYGNIFHAGAGLSDMVITTLILPVSTVVLISGQWDKEPVCVALHFFAVASTYSYTLIYMLVATESYYKHCRSENDYTKFNNMNIGPLCVLIFIVSIVVAGAGVFCGLDYNYCTRAHYGNFYFRVSTGIVFEIIPFFWTVFGMIAAYIQVRRKAQRKILYRRSHAYDFDKSITTLNLVTYLFFVLAWIPYHVIVYRYPNSSDAYFYLCAWIGLSRAFFSPFFYAIFNRTFRQAFARLFKYCCCKSALTPYRSRHRGGQEYHGANKDIRVHILQNGQICFGPRCLHEVHEL